MTQDFISIYLIKFYSNEVKCKSQNNLRIINMIVIINAFVCWNGLVEYNIKVNSSTNTGEPPATWISTTGTLWVRKILRQFALYMSVPV